MSVLACKHKLVCRLQGSLVIYTRHYPEQLHCAYACMINQEAFVWRMCRKETRGDTDGTIILFLIPWYF